MKLYIAYTKIFYGGAVILGVFDSPDKARAAFAEARHLNDYHAILEVDLNVLIEQDL